MRSMYLACFALFDYKQVQVYVQLNMSLLYGSGAAGMWLFAMRYMENILTLWSLKDALNITSLSSGTG
mgnify:CR=1 FL=1